MAKPGAMSKDPQVTIQPYRGKPANQPGERLSPGVYRSASGGLVTRAGRVLPRPAPQPSTGVVAAPSPGMIGNSVPMVRPGDQGGASTPPTDADKMYRWPEGQNIDPGSVYTGEPLPQPSANNGGKYRLSPGVYGTQEQAMDQWSNPRGATVPMYNRQPMFNQPGIVPWNGQPIGTTLGNAVAPARFQNPFRRW